MQALQKKPDCPVCGKPTNPLQQTNELSETDFHCGRTRLLIQNGDHYLSFKAKVLPKKLPNIGCPICGRPMEKAGRFRWAFSQKEDGLPRMVCDQPDHYCYVTEAWYQLHKR
jgi:endogenous inhibitor of DNA gyrase (YacG/DUF329 family)